MTDETSTARDHAPRCAIWIWSSIGACVLIVQTYVWIRWVASGPESLTRFRDTDAAAWTWAIIFQVAMLASAAVTTAVVIRGCVRRHQLTREGIFLVGFASMLWLDPMLNYFRPGFYFSEAFVNLSSWVGFLPGQMAPHSNLTAQPVLWLVGTYLGVFLPATMVCARTMRWAQRRWPTARLPVLMLVALAVAIPMDLAIELPALRTETFAYPAASHSWSIWGGETYQFPLIIGFADPMFWVACAALLVSGDNRNGVLSTERGVERVRSAWAATGLRQLAMVGVLNVFFLVGPVGLPQIGPLYGDETPKGYPTHLTGEWCGDEGQPYGPCPGPGVPIQVRTGDDPSPQSVYDTHPFFQKIPLTAGRTAP